MAHRVVITGLGVLSPIGQSVDTFFDALVAARSGVRLIPESIFPRPANAASASSPLVAAMIDFDAAAHWAPHQMSQLDRSAQFALVAAKQALESSGLPTEGNTGVYWGTGMGGAGSIDESYRELYQGRGRVRPTSVILSMSNAAAGQISMANKLRGSVINVSTACSSSASAIGEGLRAIRHGYADSVVAGGSEALIVNGILRAWDAMQALAHADPEDPARSCKPFSIDRKGLVLGEGAAALVLERADHAIARGATILAEVAGYGNAADASHISKPDADGQVRAMHAALSDAGIAPEDIGYLNAHGTATQVGDIVETEAIKRAFGAHANRLAISSTKAVHGHMMGGTGALEFIASVLAMTRGIAPPTANLANPDPQCDLDYVPNVARPLTTDAVMSNSFGFGGMNAVLVARRWR